jgi:hypothetical protein
MRQTGENPCGCRDRFVTTTVTAKKNKLVVLVAVLAISCIPLYVFFVGRSSSFADGSGNTISENGVIIPVSSFTQARDIAWASVQK